MRLMRRSLFIFLTPFAVLLAAFSARRRLLPSELGEIIKDSKAMCFVEEYNKNYRDVGLFVANELLATMFSAIVIPYIAGNIGASLLLYCFLFSPQAAMFLLCFYKVRLFQKTRAWKIQIKVVSFELLCVSCGAALTWFGWTHLRH